MSLSEHGGRGKGGEERYLGDSEGQPIAAVGIDFSNVHEAPNVEKGQLIVCNQWLPLSGRMRKEAVEWKLSIAKEADVDWSMALVRRHADSSFSHCQLRAFRCEFPTQIRRSLVATR